MRSVVLSNRIRCLGNVSIVQIFALGLVGVLAAGCSSDVTRFDRQLQAALPKAEPNAYEKAVAANSNYPDAIDQTTTASINGSGVPTPISSISPNSTPDHAGYNPNSVQPVYNQPTYQAPALPNRQSLNAPVRYSNPAYKPAPTYSSGVVKSALPKPTFAKPALPKPALPAVPSVAAAKRVAVDQIQTSSTRAVSAVKTQTKKMVGKRVAPVANKVTPIANATAAAKGGWSGVGGTTIPLRSGETLYNLSKRYGVPVSEIMRANSIASASELKAGQNILIPTYVYAQNNPVSAPDINPDTRAARSSTGLLGQPKNNAVPAPTIRPGYETSQSQPAPAKPVVTSSIVKPVLKKSAPVKPAHSASSDGLYIVQAGDSLGKISRKHGVSVATIQRANGISGSMVRLGQKLTIPNGEVQQTAKVVKAPAAVDPIVTGTPDQPVKKKTVVKPTTTKIAQAPKPYVKPTVDKTIATGAVAAPKGTGIKTLRWPVKGRVVSAFGKSNDGIDISVPEGTSVKAAENGVVIYSGNELAGFGNLILLRHADGIVTAYAHNKSNAVAKGSKVKRGQVIAKSGRTGNTDTPKLHFEVRKNSKPVNPIPYLGG